MISICTRCVPIRFAIYAEGVATESPLAVCGDWGIRLNVDLTIYRRGTYMMERKLSRKKLVVCLLGLIVLLLCIGCGTGTLISPPNGAIVMADEFDQVLFGASFSYVPDDMTEEYESGTTYKDAYTAADESGKAAIAEKYFTEVVSPVKVGSVTIKAASDAQPFEFNNLIVTYDRYDASEGKVYYSLASSFPSAQAGKKYTITVAAEAIKL